MTSHVCPICGFVGLEGRARRNGMGTFATCPSCGFEFGYHDDALGKTDASWRAEWIAEGMPWRIPEWPKPDGWDPQAQLARLLAGREGR